MGFADFKTISRDLRRATAATPESELLIAVWEPAAPAAVAAATTNDADDDNEEAEDEVLDAWQRVTRDNNDDNDNNDDDDEVEIEVEVEVSRKSSNMGFADFKTIARDLRRATAATPEGELLIAVWEPAAPAAVAAATTNHADDDNEEVEVEVEVLDAWQRATRSLRPAATRFAHQIEKHQALAGDIAIVGDILAAPAHDWDAALVAMAPRIGAEAAEALRRVAANMAATVDSVGDCLHEQIPPARAKVRPFSARPSPHAPNEDLTVTTWRLCPPRHLLLPPPLPATRKK
ncbi:hypothetical protein HDU87_001462 [Geranomyces variabilis]|uniref:Uncharacterized protein n=1 Tax=Geranomyces variabilis TaxID=109894 RepID=A0AAD5TBW0_9FUNG|nr:hypothetical protein HDU87_001462 [Geranomyces variabilis]